MTTTRTGPVAQAMKVWLDEDGPHDAGMGYDREQMLALAHSFDAELGPGLATARFDVDGGRSAWYRLALTWPDGDTWRLYLSWDPNEPLVAGVRWSGSDNSHYYTKFATEKAWATFLRATPDERAASPNTSTGLWARLAGTSCVVM